MNPREKTMAIIVVLLGGAYGVWMWGMPTVRDKVFAIAEENKRLGQELVSLNEKLGEINGPRERYRNFLRRTGSTDPEVVQTNFYNSLNELATRYGFSNLRQQPTGITEHRPTGSKSKTDTKEVRFTVSAEGTLQSVAGYLKSFYELPQICQITSLKLDSVGGRRGSRDPAVSFRATVEALVPPWDAVGEIPADGIEPLSVFVAHRDQDYSVIWNRDPFNEYVPPPPPPVVVERPTRTPTAVPPPPPPPPPVGDPQAADKVIKMALIYGGGDYRIDELLVVNTRDQTFEYVAVGGELDGGVVELVHPWGAVARRDSGDELMYPTGKTLAESMAYQESRNLYPEVAFAYEEMLALQSMKAPDDVGGNGPDESVDENANPNDEQPAANPDEAKEKAVGAEVRPEDTVGDQPGQEKSGHRTRPTVRPTEHKTIPAAFPRKRSNNSSGVNGSAEMSSEAAGKNAEPVGNGKAPNDSGNESRPSDTKRPQTANGDEVRYS